MFGVADIFLFILLYHLHQVYQGRTFDGALVAIKVQRPNLLPSVLRDIYILRLGVCNFSTLLSTCYVQFIICIGLSIVVTFTGQVLPFYPPNILLYSDSVTLEPGWTREVPHKFFLPIFVCSFHVL